jgi:hypothetical protein
MKRVFFVALVVALAAAPYRLAAAEVRLTNDNITNGYISAYQLATGSAVTNDAVINECSQALGRQNEPSVAVDPRNSNVLIGSSNDYCGVYASTDSAGNGLGPIWLGYYRSENAGASFQSSLVPGYPGDPSPYAALAHIREATAGDPVVAWDGHGRVFLDAEASGDPAGTNKTFGDVWVATFDNPTEGTTSVDLQQDGKRFVGSSLVALGSSAPNFLGKFQDKTALQADHTGSACDATVYFAVTRFSGAAGNVAIYFSRSTDHGATWSTPMKVSASIREVQDPEISITGNGHVYVTFHQFAFTNGQPDAINYVKSTDCGKTFSPPHQLVTFIPASPTDVSDPEPIPPGSSRTKAPASLNRDCGDFADHCLAGFTFFRYDVTPRSAADQTDSSSEFVYVVYAATKPGSVVSTGTTYGTVAPGLGGQATAYFLRLNGATGAVTDPTPLDDQPAGHQIFPAIAADSGRLHVIWWDSRNDGNYSATRPIGNDANGNTGPALDVFGTVSTTQGATWATPTRISTLTTAPNFEQFSDRAVPFGGDYLWVTASGAFTFTAWTDWRNTVSGSDPREGSTDEETGSDVAQCRTFDSTTGAWSPDTCPHAGGLDQNIYGASAP